MCVHMEILRYLSYRGNPSIQHWLREVSTLSSSKYYQHLTLSEKLPSSYECFGRLRFN
jgi:hypothetical protein